MPKYKMNDAVRDSILMGIHQRNFKNGAFKNSITKSTSVVESLNILLGSSQLTSSEKCIIKSCRKAFIDVRKHWSDEEPDLVAMADLSATFQSLWDIFDKDAEDRGLYVPQTCFQVMNEDGTVKKTITMAKDGLCSFETKGGIAGIPAGAPEGFIKEQMQKSEDIRREFGKTDAQVLIANRFRPETVGPVAEEKVTGKSELTGDKATTKNPNPKPKENGNTNFGKEFTHNLRGAFL